MGPLACLYLLFNVGAVSGVVFANKAVFAVFGFNFPYALTCIHAIATHIGMVVFGKIGMFQPKATAKKRLVPLAFLYVGYVVFGNLNLAMNTVGFYQITKLAVAPCAMALEVALGTAPRPTPRIVLSVLLVVSGVGISTITDPLVATNPIGMAVGLGAILCNASYTVFVAKLQRDLSLSSMQLLNEYAPIAVVLLSVLVPMVEPVGFVPTTRPTLLGFAYSLPSVGMIGLSAALGLAVSLSTFLLIGATSGLTYNVVGHVKTVIIVTGGVLLFGESISAKKVLGILSAMAGIIWFTHLKKKEAVALKQSHTPPNSIPDTNEEPEHPTLDDEEAVVLKSNVQDVPVQYHDPKPMSMTMPDAKTFYSRK